MKQVDVAIVGAGIMGLAHAIHAARAGLTVSVFERCPEAGGASVRNFGMLAVVAQAPGKQLQSARRALACWQEIAPQEAGGVGYFPRSKKPFIHIDTGRVRNWPRLSQAELKDVFGTRPYSYQPRD